MMREVAGSFCFVLFFKRLKTKGFKFLSILCYSVILIHVLLKCLYFCSSLIDFKSKFELERKESDCYNSSNTSGSQQQHPPPLLPLPTPLHPFSSSSSSSVGGIPIATPAHLPDSTTDSWSGYYGTQRQDGVSKPFSNKVVSLKQRCRDYDGRNRVSL